MENITIMVVTACLVAGAVAALIVVMRVVGGIASGRNIQAEKVVEEPEMSQKAATVEPNRPLAGSLARPVDRTQPTWTDKLITGYSSGSLRDG